MKIINDLSPLGNWLVNKYNDYPITKHKVSASRVGCNVRKNVLTNRHQHEFHERASDLFKPTLGKVQHKQILGAIKEEFGDKVVVEETFEGYDDDKGTPDLYIKYPIALGQAGWLIDLKCVNATTWLLNDTDWHHYNLQLQHNRQLLAKAGHDVTKMFLWFVFTDWTFYKANNPKTPPNFPRAEELLEIEEEVFEIPITVNLIDYYKDTPDDELPPCDRLDTWEHPSWKVYAHKKDGKPYAKAMNGGSFYTEQEANAFADRQSDPATVKHITALDRPGCRGCHCRHWCNQYQDTLIDAADIGLEPVTGDIMGYIDKDGITPAPEDVIRMEQEDDGEIT